MAAPKPAFYGETDESDGLPYVNGRQAERKWEGVDKTFKPATEARMEHFLVLGPGGAGVVCEDGEVGFLEVRVSIAGVVVPWGIPVFVGA